MMNDINLGVEVLAGLEQEKWLSNRWLSEHAHHSNNESKNKTESISVSNCRQYNVRQQEPNYSQTRQEEGVRDQKIPVSNILEDQFHGIMVCLSMTQQYLNTVRKAEHNHIGGDEAHCAHRDEYGIIKGYCHKTSSPQRLKGYMSAKLLDLDDKKEVVLSLSIPKHNRDIFSSFTARKCMPRMLLKFDVFTSLALLQEDAGARLALPGSECNESKHSCSDSSTPLPCSPPARTDPAAQRECSVGRLSRKTKALRMRMRRAAENRYKDYISSSDEDH